MKKIATEAGIMALLILVLVGCSKQKQMDDAGDAANRLMPLTEFIMIPDSVATAEQLALLKKIEKVSVCKIEARDSIIVLSVGRDYFIENGIPAEYYDSMLAEIDSTNAFMAKMRQEARAAHAIMEPLHLAADLEENKRNYEEYLAAVGEDSISYREYCRIKFEKMREEVMGGNK